jgi:AraC-like DNA-binding protein
MLRAHGPKDTRSGGAGLERSCRGGGGDRIESIGPADGVELFRARLGGAAYETHRHDTYAVGLTDHGIQAFDYRGATRVSMPGEVVALYPDEAHDGRAGTAAGFGYRLIYVEPARLADALRAIHGRPEPLPFVAEPVSTSPRLARAIRAAFAAPLEPVGADALIVALTEGLLAAERGGGRRAPSRRVDAAAVERARLFLDAERTRVVRSAELEAVTGLTRYELARQFRLLLGTSPHRYLLMRRLDFARAAMRRGRPLAEVAAEAGFADQAHFTRAFKSAFGLTPARYRALGGGARPR